MWGGGFEGPPARRRHDGEHDPTVIGGSDPIDEPGSDETVESSGEAARGQLETAREIGHAHAVLLGLRQVDEHLVVTLVEAVLGEIRLEGPEQIGSGLDERPPRGHLLVIEPSGHRSSVPIAAGAVGSSGRELGEHRLSAPATRVQGPLDRPGVAVVAADEDAVVAADRAAGVQGR